jgi:predicted dehydrogenase
MVTASGAEGREFRSMQDIGVAVAGTGFIGPVHVEALRRLGVRVAGILGSSPEKSEKARAALRLEKAYRSLDEVLADRAVEAVHLAVPNVLHHDMAKRALLAGKHVMCEKPLAMTSRESAELVNVARSTGRAAGVCYNVRFYPLNIEARDRVRRGDAGRIHSIHGSYVQDWLLHDTDYNWRVLAGEGGPLRAVADIGTHWIDLILSITGLDVEAVFADLATVHAERKRPEGEVETFSGKIGGAARPVAITTDDLGSVLFRFRGGARGSLHVSQVTAGRKNSIRYEIAGSKHALSWESERPGELWIGSRERPSECLFRDPALAGALARRFIDYPGGHEEGFPDTFKQCFRAFYEAIAGGAGAGDALYPTFEDGHREVLLCEAILRSHREERWIDV